MAADANLSVLKSGILSLIFMRNIFWFNPCPLVTSIAVFVVFFFNLFKHIFHLKNYGPDFFQKTQIKLFTISAFKIR